MLSIFFICSLSKFFLHKFVISLVSLFSISKFFFIFEISLDKISALKFSSLTIFLLASLSIFFNVKVSLSDFAFSAFFQSSFCFSSIVIFIFGETHFAISLKVSSDISSIF